MWQAEQGLATARGGTGVNFSLDFAFNDSFMPESYIPTFEDFPDTSSMPPLQDGFFENLAVVSLLLHCAPGYLRTDRFQDYGWVPAQAMEEQASLVAPFAINGSDGMSSSC